MSEPQRHEEQPGTKTNDPVEGKRTDPRATPVSAYPAERPGTKTTDPAEGGETSSGAERTPDSPRH